MVRFALMLLVAGHAVAEVHLLGQSRFRKKLERAVDRGLAYGLASLF